MPTYEKPSYDKGISLDGSKLLCSTCREYKSPGSFNIDRSRTRGYLSYCKECAKKKRLERKDIRKEQSRKAKLKIYGMTLKSFEELMKKQNSMCAICFTKFPETWKHDLNGYALDHCHETLTVRGILCQRCNLLLGYAKDSTTILRSAIVYLSRFE